jgi:hypothetical protein
MGLHRPSCTLIRIEQFPSLDANSAIRRLAGIAPKTRSVNVTVSSSGGVLDGIPCHSAILPPFSTLADRVRRAIESVTYNLASSLRYFSCEAASGVRLAEIENAMGSGEQLKPEVDYHYSTVENMMKIVESASIWATSTS